MKDTAAFQYFDESVTRALESDNVTESKQMKVIIYYHGHCKAHDGSVSAALAKYFITQIAKDFRPDVKPVFTFEGITYNTNYAGSKLANQDLIVFVDFMFTELQDNLQIMSDAKCPIIICDHHNDKRVESIKKYLEFTKQGINNIDIQFNDKVSGVLNTINYFEAYSQLVGLGKTVLNWHPDINQFIRCINDYDMWEWQYPDTAAINAYLSTFTDEDNIAFVYDLINNQEKMGAIEVSKLYENMVETGKVIRRNQEKRVDSITNKYVEVHLPMTIETDTVTVNRTYSFATVNSIMDKNECADVFTKDYDFAIVWAFQGNYITGSIRASNENLDGFMDANKIANMSEYGMVGGGHPCASGFSIRDPKNIIKFLETFVYGTKFKKLS